MTQINEAVQEKMKRIQNLDYEVTLRRKLLLSAMSVPLYYHNHFASLTRRLYQQTTFIPIAKLRARPSELLLRQITN